MSRADSYDPMMSHMQWQMKAISKSGPDRRGLDGTVVHKVIVNDHR